MATMMIPPGCMTTYSDSTVATQQRVSQAGVNESRMQSVGTPVGVGTSPTGIELQFGPNQLSPVGPTGPGEWGPGQPLGGMAGTVGGDPGAQMGSVDQITVGGNANVPYVHPWGNEQGFSCFSTPWAGEGMQGGQQEVSYGNPVWTPPPPPLALWWLVDQ